MAQNRFRGDAPAVAQVNTVTPANVGIGNTFSLTCNGKVITFTATAGTVANVTAGLVALLAATTIAEFAEVEAADITTALTLTARTPGKPFTITSAAAGGTATLITTATTASSGPEDISTLANWTTGALPVDATDSILFSGAVNAYYGLAALAAIAPTSILFDETFSGNIGLPDWSDGGYYEYREKFLQTLATTVTNQSQSGRIKIDQGGTASVTVNAFAAGSPLDANQPAFTIKGCGANSILNAMQGSVGFGLVADTCTFATINIGSLTNPASDVQILAGPGAALTTINQVGGDVKAESNVTTWTMTKGTGTLRGSATLATLNSDEGYLYWQSTGTLATLNLGNAATLDRSQRNAAATITNSTIKAGATILDPGHKITWTNATVLDRCGLEDVTIECGKNINVRIT